MQLAKLGREIRIGKTQIQEVSACIQYLIKLLTAVVHLSYGIWPCKGWLESSTRHSPETSLIDHNDTGALMRMHIMLQRLTRALYIYSRRLSILIETFIMRPAKLLLLILDRFNYVESSSPVANIIVCDNIYLVWCWKTAEYWRLLVRNKISYD